MSESTSNAKTEEQLQKEQDYEEARRQAEEEKEEEDPPVMMHIEPEYRGYLRKLAEMEKSSEGVVAANLVRVALIGLVQRTRADDKKSQRGEQNKILLSTRYSKGKAK